MDNEIINKLSKFAFISSLIGAVTLGICPAFGIMGIVIGIVFKIKKVELNYENKHKILQAEVLGILSLALFVADIVLLLIFVAK
ncbi:MAG: hypothetical protein LIO62_07165 [Clostridiales bacterium]|nr:hypothetical protein [Clostridiales bacterium]